MSCPGPSRPTSSPCLQWSSSALQSPRGGKNLPPLPTESEQHHGQQHHPIGQHFCGGYGGVFSRDPARAPPGPRPPPPRGWRYPAAPPPPPTLAPPSFLAP